MKWKTVSNWQKLSASTFAPVDGRVAQNAAWCRSAKSIDSLSEASVTLLMGESGEFMTHSLMKFSLFDYSVSINNFGMVNAQFFGNHHRSSGAVCNWNSLNGLTRTIKRWGVAEVAWLNSNLWQPLIFWMFEEFSLSWLKAIPWPNFLWVVYKTWVSIKNSVVYTGIEKYCDLTKICWIFHYCKTWISCPRHL